MQERNPGEEEKRAGFPLQPPLQRTKHDVMHLKLGCRSAPFCKQAPGSSLASPGVSLLRAELLLGLSSFLSRPARSSSSVPSAVPPGEGVIFL